MQNSTDIKIENQLNKYMSLMESDLGQDIIPISIILICRIAIKYNLNIDWLVSTIIMGYTNELPPDVNKGEVFKFDS